MVQDEMKNINDCNLQCLPRCGCPLLLSRQLTLAEVDLVKIQVVRARTASNEELHQIEEIWYLDNC